MLAEVRIVGLDPLLMHSNRSVNVFDVLVKEMKTLTSKRTRKTEEDIKRIADIEFELALYYDETLGPYVPTFNILRCIQEGAKLTKQGKDIVRGVRIAETKTELIYKGPRDLASLIADETFRDIRPVGVQGSSVMRTRPIFRGWACAPRFIVDPTVIDRDLFEASVKKGGLYCGLLDYRPGSPKGGQYGRFDAEVVEIQETRGGFRESN